LRIRQITLEPGAVVAHHSHAERPIAVYVISGEFTEVPDDGPDIVHGPGTQWVGPGTQWVEHAGMRHWGANRGDVPTVLVAVDIVPEE
jgi:quercetin dioxygenase-like cupin family protein